MAWWFLKRLNRLNRLNIIFENEKICIVILLLSLFCFPSRDSKSMLPKLTYLISDTTGNRVKLKQNSLSLSFLNPFIFRLLCQLSSLCTSIASESSGFWLVQSFENGNIFQRGIWVNHIVFGRYLSPHPWEWFPIILPGKIFIKKRLSNR